MKKYISILLIIPVLGITSCKKDNNDDQDNIRYASINKEYVLRRDVKSIHDQKDEVSLHVDSILNGLINTQIISSGTKSFDLDGDKVVDLGFEILDLTKFNVNALPDSFETLAARVVPSTLQVLDNSTYGYADALNADYTISNTGKWTTRTCVLGTFLNAGLFNGKGEKYLGIRLTKNGSFMYGWIKLYCSQHNDTLRIIDYAYNQQLNKEIKARQK